MAEMARVSDRLRGVAAFLSSSAWGYNVDVLLEAAAELDRREAIVAAAEAWAREHRDKMYETAVEAAMFAAVGLDKWPSADALKG
jgi:hypothetical protein